MDAHLQKVKYFTADTESEVPEYKEINDVLQVKHLCSVRVWAVGISEIGTDNFYIYDSIEDFNFALDNFSVNAVIYFHNLKWDLEFFISYWSKIGWSFNDMKVTKMYEKPSKHCINYLITDTGVVYMASFRNSKNKIIEFRDSYKILPFSVEYIGEHVSGMKKLKGSIDYTKKRPCGYKMNAVEKNYLKHDVMIMNIALNKFFNKYKNLDKVLTIGSYALKNFKEETGFKSKLYKRYFPKIEDDVFFRRAYKGGWCYVNDKIQDIPLYNLDGQVYDVNSLYPYVMTLEYPRGDPIPINEFDSILKSEYPYYVEFEATFHLRKNKFPFLQDKNTLFSRYSHVKETDIPLNMVLSRPDFEIFNECYEADYFQFIKGYYFKEVCSPFIPYIEKWFSEKKEAKLKNDKVSLIFSKLMLNSLYGKFAQNPIKYSKNIIVDENSYHYETFEDLGRGGYIVIGAYITAYARSITVRAANKNYKKFLYSDTDSVHLSGKAVGIEIDKYKLGAWDNESSFDRCRMVRQKTYIEGLGEKYVIKCAGMPVNVKKVFLEKYKHDPLKYFTYGLSLNGKLMRKKVEGGQYLYPSTFRII